MSINTKSNQKGFTLLEAVLAGVIFSFVMFAIGTFYVRVMRQNENLNQAAQTREQAGNNNDALAIDFALLGRGLSLHPSEIFPAQELSTFVAHPDYQVVENTVSRIASSSNTPLRSAFLWSGSGALTASSADSFTIELNPSEAGSDTSRSISISNGRYSVMVGGVEQAAGQIPPTYQNVQFINRAGSTPGTCDHAFEVAHMEVYKFTDPCPNAWFEVDVTLNTLGSIDVSVTAPRVRLNYNADPRIKLPLLPTYAGTRMTAPVISIAASIAGGTGSYALLRTNGGSQPVYLRTPAQFSTAGVSYLEVTEMPGPAANAAGDIFLVADYFQNKSVLVQLQSQSGGKWVVVPVTSVTPALSADYENLASLPPDYELYKFPVGSRIVKMAPPILWKAISESVDPRAAQTGLFRREGNTPWVLVLPNIQQFLITNNQSESGYTFDIKMITVGENVGMQGDAVETKLTFAPRGLNRSLDVQ